jgi:hypothetical protein
MPGVVIRPDTHVLHYQAKYGFVLAEQLDTSASGAGNVKASTVPVMVQAACRVIVVTSLRAELLPPASPQSTSQGRGPRPAPWVTFGPLRTTTDGASAASSGRAGVRS